jgi:thiol-disulfide isomerase/thioredoxin
MLSRAGKPWLAALILSGIAVAAYLAYRGLLPLAAEDESSPLVEELPELVLDDLAGNPTPISSWPGKPLIINFWGTWCAPCLREIPLLIAYQAEHPETQIVGIAIDGVDPVVAFAEEMQFNYPLLVGADGIYAAGAFGVDFVAMPFTVFTAPSGAAIGVHVGELTPAYLDNLTFVLTGLAAGDLDIATARGRLALRE